MKSDEPKSINTDTLKTSGSKKEENNVVLDKKKKLNNKTTENKKTKTGKDSQKKSTVVEGEEDNLKGEIENFMANFNYDTDSSISEPEGLDDIDDPE